MALRNLLSGRNLNIMQYLKSRPLSHRSSVFIFACLIMFFFTFQIWFFQGRSTLLEIVINDNYSLSNQASSHKDWNSIYQHLVPNFADRIIDKAQSPATCLIIVRVSDGGIGNRMFVFASAYGLARLHRCNLYIAPQIIKDLRSVFILNLTNTPVHLVTNDSVLNQPGIFQRYSACTLYKDLVKIPLSPDLTTYEMIGSYGVYGYFIQYKDEISYLFQLQDSVAQRNVPFVEKLVKNVWNIRLNLGKYTKDNVTHQYLKSILTRPPPSLIPVTWIGIHIRRGDFLTFFKINTSIEYLNVAMNFYRRKYFNCRFLIASDDKAYVKTNLGHNPDVFITPKDFCTADDLSALALCEHTIVTAGSYGWWAAWLAGGNVIHDLGYPMASQGCIREHYFPPWFVFPHNSSS